MFDFFSDISTLEKIYWIVAIFGTVVFSILFVLTLIGADSDADIDGDTGFDLLDGDSGVQFFSFKNTMAFLTIFGWSGLTAIKEGFSTTSTVIISVISGGIMMVIIAYLFYWIYKMVQSGTLKIENAIGKSGEVYIPIGAHRSKSGKISIAIQGSLKELDAITDEKEDLATGTLVRVKEIVADNILLVEKSTKK